VVRGAFRVSVLVLFAVVMLTGNPVSGGSQNDALLFVLDASGSMWGRVEGGAKIEVARRVLIDLVATLPESSPVGLLAYGHNRKGDCADIELLIAPQSGATQQVAAVTRTLVPRGQTPIADALRRAGEHLNALNEPSSVVLISDGVETCGGDPCAVAESLAAANAALRIYVVGFDVGRDEIAPLQCIAEKGGGRFFQAGDAASLTDALHAVRKHALEAEPLPEPEPAPEAPEPPKVDTQRQATQLIKIQGPGEIRLRPASWVRMPPRSWILVNAETGDEVGRSTGDSIRVKSGLYQIVWRQKEHDTGAVLLTEVIRVESGKTVEAPLDTGLRVTAPETVRPPRHWRLLDAHGRVTAHFRGKEGFLPQLAPAGVYSMVWRQTEHGSPDVPVGEVEIHTGRLTEKVLDTGFVAALPEWLEGPYAYILTDSTGKEFVFRETGVLPMTPGEYTLIWRQTKHGHSPTDWGKVTIAQDRYTPLPVNSGIRFVPFADKPPYRILFRDLTRGKTLILSGGFGPMPLPPGKYAVDLHETKHGSTPITLVEEIEVTPETLLELEM